MTATTVPVSLRRTLVGALAVLLAAGAGRMGAMLVTATIAGAELASTDPAVRRDGLLLGTGLVGGALAGAAALALVVRPAPRRMLALERPTTRALVLWLFAGVALAACFDGAAWLAGRPLVEASWIDAYRTAPPALLVLGLVAVSIFEELFFRGLLQGGLAATRLRPAGAIAIVALLFAVSHFPEDAWRFFDVLCGGVLLGLARHLSGSTIPGMIPHVLGNLKVLGVIAWLE